jgi:hypothetical protein
VSLVGLDNDYNERTQRPGPAIAIDVMRTPWDAPVAIGGHLGIGVGFNHEYDARNFPRNTDRVEAMIQLGVLLEVRQGPVALGVGLNLQSHHSWLTARDDGNEVGSRDSHRALGCMAQLAIDVAATDRGTFALLGNVDRFGALDVLELLSGGDADSREGTTFMLGVAFRPR